VFDFEFQLRKS